MSERAKVRLEGGDRLDEKTKNTADLVDQGAVLPDLEKLINIPIEIPECSGVLKEISNSELWHKGKDPAEITKGTRRTWKRLKSKENTRVWKE